MMFNATKCPRQFSNVSISGTARGLHAMVVSAIFLSVCTILANFTLIVALCRKGRSAAKRPTDRSPKSSSQLLISLASCDVILGFLSMPLGTYLIVNDGHFELGPETCMAYLWLDKILSSVSIYHVTSIALDRYIAACMPMVYRSRSARMVHLTVSLCWAAPFAINSGVLFIQWRHGFQRDLFLCLSSNKVCLPVFSLRYVIAAITLDFALPLFAIFTLYFLIAKEIFKLKKSSCAFTENSSRTQQIETVAGILVTKLDGADVSMYGLRPSPESQVSHGSFPASDVDTPLQEEDATEKLFDLLPEDVVRPSTPQVRESPVDNEGRYRFGSMEESIASYPDLSFILQLRERGFVPRSQEMISAADPSGKVGHETRKAYTVIICVVACATVCWMPFNVYLFLIIYTDYALPYWPLLLFTWLGYLHSAVNPVICLFIESVRHAVLDLFRVRS